MVAPDSPRMVDVFDRGPRFREHRYAVRIRHADGTRVIVVDEAEDRSTAVHLATLVREVITSWWKP